MPPFCSQLKTGFQRAACRAANGLVLAVSGGADSIALLHGTLEICPVPTFQIVVAHLNHGLRGTASDADAAFVDEVASNLRVPTVISSVDVTSAAKRSGETIEEAARRIRYDFLRRVAEDASCGSVVSAHHRSDQAETVLHHLIRGTGLRGLQGMPYSRRLGEKVTLVRPMLEMEQSVARQYLAERALPFREDSSNADTAFTRNRLRHELLTLLKNEFNPQIEKRLAALSVQATDTMDCLDYFAEDILKQVVLEQQPDSCRLHVAPFTSLPIALVRHVLTILWKRQSWPRQKMNFQHWQTLALTITHGEPRSGDLPQGLHFARKENLLHVFREGS